MDELLPLPPAIAPCPHDGCYSSWALPMVLRPCGDHAHITPPWEEQSTIDMHLEIAHHLRTVHGDEKRAVTIEKNTIRGGRTHARRNPRPFDQDDRGHPGDAPPGP